MFGIQHANTGLLAGETGNSETDVHVLPENLEAIPPGPFLFAILDRVDRSKLSGYDAVRVLEARERLSSHVQAESLADVIEVARHVDGDSDRIMEASDFASAEIAAALNLTRRGAERLLEVAVDLIVRLPSVWRLLQAGDIDLPRAKVLAHGTEHLDEKLARKIVDRVNGDASGLTTGQLRARVQRLCLEADAEAARKRYERRVEDRRFETGLTADSTGNVFVLDSPPDEVVAVATNVDALARSLRGVEGETRTMDQLRADVALDLLKGRQLGRCRDRVITEIRVEATTLAELDDKAAEIPGMGPVIADIARQFKSKYPNAEWRYAITHQGRVIDSGITRRRPTATQRRRIEARSPTCVHPGCRVPSINCDIDHTIAYSDGGPTTDCNLAPLCRCHHRVKHEAGWQLKRLADGVYQWISRLGHTYMTNGQSP